jgi:hypothetical protein
MRFLAQILSNKDLAGRVCLNPLHPHELSLKVFMKQELGLILLRFTLFLGWHVPHNGVLHQKAAARGDAAHRAAPIVLHASFLLLKQV